MERADDRYTELWLSDLKYDIFNDGKLVRTRGVVSGLNFEGDAHSVFGTLSGFGTSIHFNYGFSELYGGESPGDAHDKLTMLSDYSSSGRTIIMEGELRKVLVGGCQGPAAPGHDHPYELAMHSVRRLIVHAAERYAQTRIEIEREFPGGMDEFLDMFELW